MRSLRDSLVWMAGLKALRDVGASEEEAEEALSSTNVQNLTTWEDHRLWARVVLAQHRARLADEKGNGRPSTW